MLRYTYELSYETPTFKGTVPFSTEEQIKSLEEANQLGEILIQSCNLTQVLITDYKLIKQEDI